MRWLITAYYIWYRALKARMSPIVTAGHTLEFGLGEGSPLARVYDLDGFVLLLGVGHGVILRRASVFSFRLLHDRFSHTQ